MEDEASTAGKKNAVLGLFELFKRQQHRSHIQIKKWGSQNITLPYPSIAITADFSVALTDKYDNLVMEGFDAGNKSFRPPKFTQDHPQHFS